jgi:hypothetical protein
MRLQLVVMEIISLDQFAFPPMRSILDNIFLTCKTIHYAKQSWQPLFFLKRDFSKAFDKVNFRFLFQALQRLGFLSTFIHMIQLQFQEAIVWLNINGKAT